MSNVRPPIVAVTATTKVIDGIQRVQLNEAYVRALEAVGVVPLVASPLDTALAGPMLDRVDGLLLSGGEDVDPARFGATPHPALGPVHTERDAWELALVLAARERRTPTLAICRGVQLLNVALGGTLVQDIPGERPSPIGHQCSEHRAVRVHPIELEPDSRLARALGPATEADDGSRDVNSSHHQSIDCPARSLRIVARAPDGIVEGVETEGDWWVLGVQWHPEELVDTPEPWDRGLFAAFAMELRRRAQSAER
jgi:putative glutamine amidotransferase